MRGELQPQDPQQIGPYQLIRQLGSGGMGRVYLGRSASGRLVAVKVIRAELAADPGFRARFRREVAVAQKVDGLYTAVVVDADADGPVPWLATAYVAGPSLAEAVESYGPLPTASLCALAAGLAAGLSAIHAAGLVHRDLKPTNVLLADDGPRVVDFGLAQAVEANALTQAGTVVGSAGYLSPEQVTGEHVGPPCDVFSLGAVLTFAATGRLPFGAGDEIAMLYRVIHGPPDLDGVPVEVLDLVRRCLAKDPGERPTAADLLAELGDTDLAEGWLSAPRSGRRAGSVAQPTLASIGSGTHDLLVRTRRSEHQLESGTTYLIGRDPVSDIVFADARVSWRHAAVRTDGDSWIIEDLGSTNGTFLGLQRVDRIEISADCVVRLANPADGPLMRFMLQESATARSQVGARSSDGTVLSAQRAPEADRGRDTGAWQQPGPEGRPLSPPGPAGAPSPSSSGPGRPPLPPPMPAAPLETPAPGEYAPYTPGAYDPGAAAAQSAPPRQSGPPHLLPTGGAARLPKPPHQWPTTPWYAGQVGALALAGHFVAANWQWFIGTAVAIAAVLVAVLH